MTGLPVLAACSVAVAAGPVARAALVGLAGALPSMLAAPLVEGGLLLLGTGLALPLAAWANRQVRTAGRHDAELGQAAAAGVGLSTFVIAGLSLLYTAGSWTGLANLGTGAVVAMTALGIVGKAAFDAVPCESEAGNIPALYQTVAAAGLSAGALMVTAGMVDFLSLAVPILDLPRMWLYQAVPAPFDDMASIAVIMASMTPFTYLVTRGLRRVLPEASPASVAGGTSLALLSPAISTAMLAIGSVLSAPAAAVAAASMSVGAVLGAIPNLLAAWAAVGRNSDQKLPALGR